MHTELGCDPATLQFLLMQVQNPQDSCPGCSGSSIPMLRHNLLVQLIADHIAQTGLSCQLSSQHLLDGIQEPLRSGQQPHTACLLFHVKAQFLDLQPGWSQGSEQSLPKAQSACVHHIRLIPVICCKVVRATQLGLHSIRTLRLAHSSGGTLGSSGGLPQFFCSMFSLKSSILMLTSCAGTVRPSLI